MTAVTASPLPLYAVDDVIVLPFPSSTGAEPKRRPVVVLAVVKYGTTLDYLVCLVTSSERLITRRIGAPASVRLEEAVETVTQMLRPPAQATKTNT